ncbi:MAG TPA: RNA polymerase recycling motor HelD, partial [Chondromyces sp.]|nr:RNA polymerase recycling motor HelD [Chondromyces sp.]
KRGDSMEKMNQEYQKEQRRVNEVVREIDKKIESLQRHAGGLKTDIVDIRKNFWEDVTINFDEADDLAETAASLKQQAELLAERERSHKHSYDQLKSLNKLKHSPYFGRIDFHEQGETQPESIYLGTSSFLDQHDEEFLIYDWRAPVSSLYYDFPPGAAEYETPEGKIEGDLLLKRQFIIRDGQIESMFDAGVTIGDELLQEVLGKQADNQMKSIVATIQKEQNRIIRNEKSELLIVQGAAGSGKTSAALQRIAYLLYRYRKTLTAEQIVLFSPNSLFNSYISTVLPELGEENMQQATFQEFLGHRIERDLEVENPFTQMEYTLTAMEQEGYEARMEGIRFKATGQFMELLDHYVQLLSREGMRFKDITFRKEVLISSTIIQEKFYELDSSISIPNRMKQLSDWLLKELTKISRLERKKAWVEEEIQYLDKEEYLKAYQQLRRKKGYTDTTFNDFQREQDLLAKMVVQRKFKSLRSLVKRYGFIDMRGIYTQLFSNPSLMEKISSGNTLPKMWERICLQTQAMMKRDMLAYEDAAPYLYLKEKIEGFQMNTAVKHVFIDEAQDYSYFQFAFLKRIFPNSRMTVLGDLNQSIFAHVSSANGFDHLQGLFDKEKTEALILTKSYRSTRPIVEFTREMIEGGEAIEPFNREGEKPIVTITNDRDELHDRIVEQIKHLQSEGHQTIAVICKTALESEQAYQNLQNKVSLRLIRKETAAFEPGVLVIPSYLSKGVEFDAVIIYNGSREQYGRESERKLFYTSCTRAMHSLAIYSLGELTPLLEDVPETLYQLNRS